MQPCGLENLRFRIFLKLKIKNLNPRVKNLNPRVKNLNPEIKSLFCL